MPARSGCLPALALGVAVASAARAELRAFVFEGSILSVDDPAGRLRGLGAPGTPFSLMTSFDAATADGDPSAALGSYYGSEPRNDLALGLGALVWRSRDLLTVISNNLPTGNAAPLPASYDAFRQEAAFDTIAGGRHWGLFIQLLFLDETARAITSDGLPAHPPDPATFGAAAQLLVTGAVLGEDGAFTLLASVTSAREAPSPGPGVGAGAILALLGATRRRRCARVSRPCPVLS